MTRPTRKTLPHEVPSWVEQGARHFITINASCRGHNTLAHSSPAYDLLRSAVFYHHLHRWHLWLALIMPDHLHMIATFDLDLGLKKAVSAWKGYQNRMLGIDWQPRFFDHRLRNDDAFTEKMTYVRLNPVRTGLVEKPEDWPYFVDYRMIENGWTGDP